MRRADSFEKTLMLGKIEGGGERDDRGWDGWMASATQWTWVWENSGSWWWTGRPGVLQSMGSQSQTWMSDWTKLRTGQGFPGGASGKELSCQCRRHKRLRFDSLGWEDPLEKEMATHSSILDWEIPWTEKLMGYSPWGRKRVRHNLATKQQQRVLSFLLKFS